MTPQESQSLVQRLELVRQRIDAAARKVNREPDAVALLAVSKTQPASQLKAAWLAGQRRFGESYVQEALAKIQALQGLEMEWHFIGPLQSNKTRAVAEHFHWVHSLDRLKLARRLSEQRPADMPPLQVCLQVNISGETAKSGVHPDELAALARAVAALPRLTLRGLMGIPARSTDFATQRRAFHALGQCRQRLLDAGLALDTLSMGMTGDLEAAIAEGATLVRVGSGIFGPRPAA